MFQQGLQDQEFVEVMGEDGKARYSWTTQEHSTARGSSGVSKMSGSVELDSNTKALEDARFETWNIGVFGPSTGSGGMASGSRPSPLAIMDAEKEMTDAHSGPRQRNTCLLLSKPSRSWIAMVRSTCRP